jgi:hypothetical protein
LVGPGDSRDHSVDAAEGILETISIVLIDNDDLKATRRECWFCLDQCQKRPYSNTSRQQAMIAGEESGTRLLTARDKRTTLWLVCSLIEWAIKQARPPVPATATRIVDIFKSIDSGHVSCVRSAGSSVGIARYKQSYQEAPRKVPPTNSGDGCLRVGVRKP